MWLDDVICSIRGHQYVQEEVLNPYARKVWCPRCDRSWAVYLPTKAFLQWEMTDERDFAPGGIFGEPVERRYTERRGGDRRVGDRREDCGSNT